MSLSGFSMRSLAAEINEKAAGARIDRVYMPTKNSVVLALRRPGENLLLYVSTNSANAAAYFIEKNFENPTEPPVFCMVLRKQLETGRVAAVRQIGADRFIAIDIDAIAAGGKIVTKTLYLELMGKYSNIILADEEGRITDCLKKIGDSVSRVRTVLPGESYTPPPAPEKANPFEVAPEEIAARLKTMPDAKLAKALVAVCMGFGPDTAQELLYRAELNGQSAVADLSEDDFAALMRALGLFVKEPPAPTLVTDEQSGKVMGFAAHSLNRISGKTQVFSTMSEMLAAADKLLKSYTPPRKDILKKLVKNELNRTERKIVVLEKELAAAENAEEFRRKADNIMAHKNELNDHADSLVKLADIYGDGETTVEIAMDKRLSVIGNYEAYYKKYNKLKRAQDLLVKQTEVCRNETAYLLTVEMALFRAETLTDIAEIEEELTAGGYLKKQSRKKPGQKSAPYRFVVPGKENSPEILVGKNNTQNDRLTFKTAAKHDIWLHAKDIPGSHVILRTDGTPPDEDALLFAAKVAARFSKAGDSSNVPVDYTECRQVKKPVGAKPGFVNFFKQKTLYVNPLEAAEELDKQMLG